jgi:hypothetical protein
MNVADAMVAAERKAWDSLARYKFWMFGYHAAQWVLLNQLDSPERMPNPFKKLVQVAREHVAPQPTTEKGE